MAAVGRISRVKKTGFLALCLLAACLFQGCAPLLKTDADRIAQDGQITSRVESALQAETSLDTIKIRVETYRGVVQLSGFVDSPGDIRKAGDLAASVPGIISVKNDLAVHATYSAFIHEQMRASKGDQKRLSPANGSYGRFVPVCDVKPGSL